MIAALAAVAGRLVLLRDFGTSLPYQDQWKFTAVDTLQPWLDGTLTLGSFFAPINDHVDALGRFYLFGTIRASGQWNNLFACALNTAFIGWAVYLFVATVAPAMGRFRAVILAVVAGLIAALPYGWENTLFAIQIVVFLEIALGIFLMRAMAVAKPFSRHWWLGQAAAGLVLLTQRSGVLVLAPVAALHLWRWLASGRRDRGELAGLAFAAAWAAVFLAITPAFAETAGMKAGSWQIALDALLRQLGWPLPHPGWAFLVWLPLGWLVVDRAGRRQLARTEVFLVLVALWVAAHAAAIGYARGGVTTGFVSRYTDFLIFGLFANAAALLLLSRTLTGLKGRLALALLAAGWSGLSAWGLWTESGSNHAGYNLGRRLVMNEQNLAAVRNYIVHRDSRLLESEAVRTSLYPHPPTVGALLDNPRFRALLPPETGAPEARGDQGRFGTPLQLALRFGPELCVIAAMGLLGAVIVLARKRTDAPLEPLPPSRWSSRQVAGLGGLAIVPLAGAFLAWGQPFVFDPGARWAALLQSSAPTGQAVPMDFTATVGRAVTPGELQGAVTTEPLPLRPFLHGTLLGGADYTGIVHTSPVKVEKRFAVALLTGWPNHPGNAARWQLRNPATAETVWLPALGLPAGPGNSLRLWTEPLELYRGWMAELFLFDGTSGERGWVGVAPPVLTDDPAAGARWLARLDNERAESTHHALAGALVLLIPAWFAAWIRARRQETNRASIAPAATGSR